MSTSKTIREVPMAPAATGAPAAPAKLNSFVLTEIQRILGLPEIHEEELAEFARFVIANHKKKEPKPVKPKALKPAEIKAAVFDYFGVGEKRTGHVPSSGVKPQAGMP